jgi:hypothetical protein
MLEGICSISIQSSLEAWTFCNNLSNKIRLHSSLTRQTGVTFKLRLARRLCQLLNQIVLAADYKPPELRVNCLRLQALEIAFRNNEEFLPASQRQSKLTHATAQLCNGHLRAELTKSSSVLQRYIILNYVPVSVNTVLSFLLLKNVSLKTKGICFI